MVNDQEDIRKIRERTQNKKGVSMEKMEQVLHELKEELRNQEDALADYQVQDLETDAEWITEGWTEGLTFAIRKIEEAMKPSQEDSVKNIRKFLSPS